MEQKDRELLKDLIIESREHMAAIEPDLLTLEKEKDHAQADLINRIFRDRKSVV
jgi:chemotaxis protein histidine kinase CheA